MTPTIPSAQASDEPMPCPFCKCDQVSIDAYSVQPDNFHSAYAECADCGACGPNALTVDGWLPSKEEAVAEAIKAWNALTTPRATADLELCEAVGKLIKAKGRFHTEQNYAAVVKAYDAATKGAKP